MKLRLTTRASDRRAIAPHLRAEPSDKSAAPPQALRHKRVLRELAVPEDASAPPGTAQTEQIAHPPRADARQILRASALRPEAFKLGLIEADIKGNEANVGVNQHTDPFDVVQPVLGEETRAPRIGSPDDKLFPRIRFLVPLNENWPVTLAHPHLDAESATLADGAPLEWISEQMVRSKIDTTRKHYARWLPSADDHILDALNAKRSETGHFSDTRENAI